jgi:hypothetical protein
MTLWRGFGLCITLLASVGCEEINYVRVVAPNTLVGGPLLRVGEHS